MLGKLIKHEWKSVYKLGSILLITIFVVTLMGCIVLRTPIVSELLIEEAVLNEMQSILVAFMSVTSLVLYILLLVGAVYGILIYMGVHFYKTMYTDQGYLTHTLPVNAHQILISKIFVSSIWILFVYIAVFVSVIALIMSMVAGITEGIQADTGFSDFWNELMMLLEELDFDTAHFIVVLILSFVISPFSAAIQMFGALTIGQLSKKYKLLMGILSYIGLIIVNSIISSLTQAIMEVGHSLSASEMSMSYMASSYDVALITACITGIIIYIISHYIVSHKLNMD